MLSELIHIDWEDFHFLRPIFLWLFLPAMVALVFGLLGLREEVKWKKVIAPHLRPYIIKKGSEKLRTRMQALLFVFISMAILGVSGPTWSTVEVPGQTLETPVVVLLDLSQSMMATDIQPNRLERAKFKINDLLEANPRARIALIGFAGTAHTVVPLTTDYHIIRSHLEGLSPQIMPFPGTNLQAALQVADTLTQVTKAPARVVLFSDEFSEESFELLQNYTIEGESIIDIFPMNTVSGAEVPVAGGSGAMKDQAGNIVLSVLDREVLEKLHSVERITVHTLTLDKSDVEFLAGSIADSIEFKEEDEKKEDDWQDRGLWFAFPFALFVLWSFRRGRVIFSLVFIAMLSSCSGNFTFVDLWSTQDFQAQKLYESGDYSEAAGLYTDPMHKGVSYFKAGEYESAIQSFSQDSTAMGAYNLGLAYFQNGDYAAAELAFGKALEMNPELNDARNNQALLGQIMAGTSEVNPEDIEEVAEEAAAENTQNSGPEDLSGGGQEASEEDMKKERQEETVNTDVRKGKELDEVPEDFESGRQENSQKILMRKVDDDPSLFLKRKFAHQVKTQNMKPKADSKQW